MAFRPMGPNIQALTPTVTDDVTQGASHTGNTWYKIAHISLSAGKYIVIGNCNLTNSSAVALSIGIGASEPSVSTEQCSVTGTQAMITLPVYVELNATTTVYLWGYGTHKANARNMYAIKLQ